MTHLTNGEFRNFVIQAMLIGFYIVLAVLFGLERKTWPMAVYYLGCLVKDSGVLVLGWMIATAGR
jgi:hypothetical protein